MDKRIILILVIVIVVIAGVGGALFFLTKQPTTIVTPTVAPVATPVSGAQAGGTTLTASSQAPLTAGQPGSIDVYIDTKGVKVDGFQFIATLAGSSLPTVPDSDSATDGIQIQPAILSSLAVSTNSVTSQDGTFIIRYAMIAQDSVAGFSTDSPTKIASIPVSTGTGGKVTLAFNQQNSRVRLTSGGDDALMGVTDASVDVIASTATNASGSGSLASTATSSATTTTSAATSQFCLASCFTDSDCAAGFVCETDRCVNPACPTSQTCGCGATAGATPVATTRPVSIATPIAVAAPTPLMTPVATPVEDSTIVKASSSGQLPSSGSFEYTLLTLGAGLLLVGGGVFLTAKQEA